MATETPRCPMCRQPGPAVDTVTVRALALPEALAQVSEAPWHLCLTAICPVAYHAAGRTALTVADLKVPLHFKQGAHPRYACYCNKVTEEEVGRLVRERGVAEMPAIIRLLRDEVQSDCRHRNPFGRCCSERFHQVVQAALAGGEDRG